CGGAFHVAQLHLARARFRACIAADVLDRDVAEARFDDGPREPRAVGAHAARARLEPELEAGGYRDLEIDARPALRARLVLDVDADLDGVAFLLDDDARAREQVVRVLLRLAARVDGSLHGAFLAFRSAHVDVAELALDVKLL